MRYLDLAFVIAVLLQPAVAGDASVAQFRHGPDHSGAFSDPGPAKIGRQLWVYATNNRMFASPVVAQDTVFIGGMDGRLHAIDLKTGRGRWTYSADAPISATAAVAQGTVFFQTNANSIYAIRANDGQLLWRRTMGASVVWHNIAKDPDESDWDYYTSSPLLAEGRIYIGSGDSNIYALDAATGKTLWAVKTGSRVRATPATDGKTLYIGGFDGVMYALDIETGTPRWHFKTAGNDYFPVGEIQSSAALASGLAIFGSRDGYMYALDAKTGKPVWKDNHDGSWVIGSPAVADGKVCVGGSDDHIMRCNDLKTGKILWTTKVGGNVFSSPAVAGGYLYAGTFEGLLHRFSLATGEKTDRYFDERIYSSPWIAGDTVVIAIDDGTVRALSGE